MNTSDINLHASHQNSIQTVPAARTTFTNKSTHSKHLDSGVYF